MTNGNARVHYLDNASTTHPKPASILEGLLQFCSAGCLSPGRSGFDLALGAQEMVSDTRRRMCRLLGGTDPNRLVFGYNATDALNLVIFGILRRGGHVVASRLDHNAVLRPIAHCVDDFGATVTLVGFDRRGYIDPGDVARAIRPDTKLVVLTHGSNVLGTVQPVAEVGAICRERGVPFCIDAAQTAGMIPIDMRAMHVDMVAFTGHKSLLGPMGIGGLCVGPDVVIPHSRAGGTGVKSAERRQPEEYPYRLECGTPNVMGITGLHRGLEYIESQGGPAAIHAREMRLAEILWRGLREIDGVTLYGAEDLEARTPVFAFNIRGFDCEEAGRRLDTDFHVACRTGLHCAPLVHEGIGTAPRGAIRFSLGPLTEPEDVEAGLAGVRALAAERR